MLPERTVAQNERIAAEEWYSGIDCERVLVIVENNQMGRNEGTYSVHDVVSTLQ